MSQEQSSDDRPKAQLYVLKEEDADETRVAATPETIKHYVRAGFSVAVEAGAGDQAAISDEEYRGAGAQIDDGKGLASADIVLAVAPPTPARAAKAKQGALWIGHMAADQNLPTVKALADAKISTIAMELIPRISRAQSMDALSSQANLAGYKAVLVGAARSPRMFPLMMTAAGTIRPANIVVLGAGVAGLQAIATAKRLGAVVEVSDVRPAAKEQVESLGGKFIPLPESLVAEGEGGYARAMTEDEAAEQRAIVKTRLLKADVVITTALVPGRPAPKLIGDDALAEMKPGAVIVDIAASRGGNTTRTENGKDVVVDGVTIVGATNLARTMSVDASALYARNIKALIDAIAADATVALDLEDEVVDGALLTHQGEVRHAPTATLLNGGS